ncbi:hypothetical protein Droror1_Dr00008963 [Drosera rotundifolia]
MKKDHPSSSQNKAPRSSPWQWPACAHLKTLSFRATSEPCIDTTIDMGNETFFTNTTQDSSVASSTRSEESGSDYIDTMIIHGLRSDRLFFEPGKSNSIIEDATTLSSVIKKRSDGGVCCSRLGLDPYKESVFLTLDSKDPVLDFRVSMEEMIRTHDLNDWDSIEELLVWFLMVNEKENYGYIVDAFVDLLLPHSTESERTETPTPMTAASSSSSSSSSLLCTCSPSSPLSMPSSSLTTPCLSLDEIDDEEDENGEEISHLAS